LFVYLFGLPNNTSFIILVGTKFLSRMPFHVTLLGVYRGTEEDDPINNITDELPYIYEYVSKIASSMGSKWAGNARMTIQHAPNFHVEGVLHAGKEPATP
jgi:hypothetical protein